MKISRFQLKLTIIFLLLLLIPATMATLFTRYILREEQTGMDVEQRVEEVLQEVSEIVDDMISEAEAECQAIAEDISSDSEILELFRSSDDLGDLIDDIVPLRSELSIAVFDFRNDMEEGKIRFSSSDRAEDIPTVIISDLKADTSAQSYREGGIVYGSAPILDGDEIMGATVVHQELGQDLVKKYMDLVTLLQVYALKPDLGFAVRIGVLALVAFLTIAGVILGWLLARSVTKPILSLVDGTQEIAKGNLDHRVEVQGKDEIATLIKSFNSMTYQLKASREREVRAERLAAWREVARRIAHEIKNPLTPIQLSMYRLRKNLGGEKYEDIFQQAYTSITNEVENLRNMVTEFSDFARMPKPRMKPENPEEIIRNAINLYTGLPENINLEVEIADNLPQVMADADQIRQVLHNIIGNAVDAMPDGGQLSVRARQTGDDITIEVSDTGCGIPEDVKDRIFTPYFTTKETGTGLGMAIAAQIIEEHGGEIDLESEENVGTTVTIKLKATDSRDNAEEEEPQ